MQVFLAIFPSNSDGCKCNVNAPNYVKHNKVRIVYIVFGVY